jgi:hypothetical protein
MGKLYEFKKGDQIKITTHDGTEHTGVYRGTKEVADYPCAILKQGKDTTPIPNEDIANVQASAASVSTRGRKRTGYYLEEVLRAAQLDFEESEARELPHAILSQHLIDKAREELSKLLNR